MCLTGLIPVSALQAASQLNCLPGCSPTWHKYQLCKQVYLLAELAQVPAQQAGLSARRAGTGTSSASRSTCSPSWLQPQKQVYLLAKLVPAQQAGLPACQAGTSPASRFTCSPSWYQPTKQVYLLAKPADLLAGLLAELAQVPALQAGLPARRAGT
ncbi:hypothetical protein PCANC_17948 [Puccinia coronata f. sp. avenae]|uniref:Uncharacterized protein n=1 Tax=Puccinia coronata f. sp. avenae TaxID=200324 RepID=A0A2N5UR23_9BASI|nr:hypothetical protein PCANC_17948 [Puccinia coronata f. sp. avenae]